MRFQGGRRKDDYGRGSCEKSVIADAAAFWEGSRALPDPILEKPC